MTTATTATGRRRGLRGLARRANPAFAAAAVAVPLLALTAALSTRSLELLSYVHVMAGVHWTGIDLFMGLVVGPVLGGLEADRRAAFFERFTPKMTFLMPVLAAVTITGGIALASRLGRFPNATPWLSLMTLVIVVPVVLSVGVQFDALRDLRLQGVLAVVLVGAGAGLVTTWSAMTAILTWVLAALVIVTLLSISGFGVLLPGDVRIYRQIVSDSPDAETTGRLGLRNARLSGVQGLLQLIIFFVMVNLRF